ncbi:hypothetical protein [Streptomyces sp. NRRL S-87]|uniref:hypothetical protein n=1 Tax=Streptomyces sp. NRRL S-87 TaxID=1463920 RepID=UPI0004C02231|nr:hypothetical protein [Streptomyces sp. NRRL S-87]
MKKIITAAALVLATVGAATPAHAADSDFGGGLASGVWNFSSAAVCLVEAAIVPVLSGGAGYVGDRDNSCSAGNVINPTK